MAKILIIDDSEVFRQSLVDILKDHETIQAGSGTEGLEKMVNTKDLDIILLDYQMPEMDGLAFCEKKRQIKDCADIPVIMITTETNAQIKAAVKSNGIRAWANKPIDPVSLLAGIEYLLRK